MAGPIKPSEVDKTTVIPDVVFDIFNTLITEKWDGDQAIVLQDTVVERITRTLGCPRHTVFDRNLLDIESAYRKAGWTVVYDKPGYNETYPATFIFKKKRK
jgi:hypothetical protein